MSFQHRSFRRLLPGMLAFAGALGLAGSAYADPPDSTFRLPRGVRRSTTGRYTTAMCDAKDGINCLGRWLLPPDWQPGMPLPERLGGVPQGPFAKNPMGPSDVLTGYSIPSSSAANGKIVAILDAPDNHALTDVNGYRSHFSIPALAKCSTPSGMPSGSGTPCFAQINYDGQPSTNTDPSTNDDGETSLDMDMISAACADCSILLVEISTNFCENEMVEGVATASKLGASAISISLGGPETTDPNVATVDAGPGDGAPSQCPVTDSWTYDTPGPFSSPGHLVFVASGDFGYDNVNIGITKTLGGASPSYPSSSPYVIAVGGTTLYTNGSGGGYGEGVWNDGRYGLDQQGNPLTSIYQDITTSGCSTEFAMPPWQGSVLSGTGCAKRATADLSAAAGFNSGGQSAGIGVYMSGQLQGAEGTSAASPLVAAIFTRLGLTTEASNDLSWIYTNAAAFNDVGSSGYPLPSGAATGDSKATNCGKICTAGTGWDGPTGVGSPNGTKLAALPISTGGPVPYPDAGVVAEGDSGTSPGGPTDASTPTDATLGGGQSDGSPGGPGPTDDGGPGTLGTPDATTPGTGGGNNDLGGGSGASSGCGCEVAGTSSARGAGWLGALLALGLFGIRRRRQARA